MVFFSISITLFWTTPDFFEQPISSRKWEAALAVPRPLGCLLSALPSQHACHSDSLPTLSNPPPSLPAPRLHQQISESLWSRRGLNKHTLFSTVRKIMSITLHTFSCSVSYCHLLQCWYFCRFLSQNEDLGVSGPFFEREDKCTMNEKGGFCSLGLLPRRADVIVKHRGISLLCCSYIQPLLCSSASGILL